MHNSEGTFPVGSQGGDPVPDDCPGIVDIARSARSFLSRAVRFLAGEAGIRQFLDIGTGLPTADNTHEIAQRINPACRIVYVDNDPLVLSHARVLLVGTPEGMTTYLDADVRDPETILAGAARTLDFAEPVALLMLGVMGNVDDDNQAYAIMRRFRDAVSSGSYLALEDGTGAFHASTAAEAARRHEEAGVRYRLRSLEQITRFFEGMDILDPGVVSLPRWRPEPGLGGKPPLLDALCGIARKP